MTTLFLFDTQSSQVCKAYPPDAIQSLGGNVFSLHLDTVEKVAAHVTRSGTPRCALVTDCGD